MIPFVRTSILDFRLSESCLCSCLLFLRYPLEYIQYCQYLLRSLPGHDKEEEGDGHKSVDEDDESIHKGGGVEAS